MTLFSGYKRLSPLNITAGTQNVPSREFNLKDSHSTPYVTPHTLKTTWR